jgi:membrane peptidoglycan carboxypeptidase
MLGNEGKRVHPRLIMKVGESDQVPVEGNQVVSSDTAHEMLHMMRAVFESPRGTAKALKIPGYVLGGKTGTAQKKNFTTGNMKGGGYVSNFVGFVPAEQPQAVIMVMIDHPKAGVYYGGSVAGPVFKRIAQNVIRKLRIPKAATSTKLETTDRVVAPSPFVQDESQESAKPARAVKAPVVEVQSKPVRSMQRTTKPAVAKKPMDRKPEQRTVRKSVVKEPVPPAATRTTRPKVVKKAEVVKTEGRSAQVIRVSNPVKRVRKPAAKVETPKPTVRKRSTAPQMDQLRELGKQAVKRLTPKAPVKPASKPKVAPSQSKPRTAPTQSKVAPKRTASDRVNRSR